jgi:hypothetical protein
MSDIEVQVTTRNSLLDYDLIRIHNLENYLNF